MSSKRNIMLSTKELQKEGRTDGLSHRGGVDFKILSTGQLKNHIWHLKEEERTYTQDVLDTNEKIEGLKMKANINVSHCIFIKVENSEIISIKKRV